MGQLADVGRDEGRLEPVLELDDTVPQWITIVGRKGSGKSYLARAFFDSYNGDRLLIDPNGDVDLSDLDDDEHVEKLSKPFPDRWPEPFDLDELGHPRRRRRSTLRYVPDPRSPTFIEDMDAVVGLAMVKGDCMLWIDEGGMLTRGSYTPPNTRWLLHQGRHHRVSFMPCQPRSIDINPLYLAQADYVAVFDLPHHRDRERIAANIGYPPQDFEAVHAEIWRPAPGDKGKWTGFAWWESVPQLMTVMPPLPPRQRARAARTGQRFDQHDDQLVEME
ncbi:MAG TPA: hypothetical protein VGX21_13160 [Methylomirabilota bacterium]|jgi:hypothetical protein|nr:hypothetical protein [Methylomirabilota bacterium]